MNQANLIVARIERARQDRGISVAELARRINVDRKRLWYVLNGQRSMHVDEFVRLCAVMDMSLACFLTKEQASDLAETRRRMAEDYGPASHAGPFRFYESESESTPIPLTPFTPPSGGLRLWASWPLRTRRG